MCTEATEAKTNTQPTSSCVNTHREKHFTLVQEPISKRLLVSVDVFSRGEAISYFSQQSFKRGKLRLEVQSLTPLTLILYHS